MLFSRWYTTKLQAQMDFQLNFISFFGEIIKGDLLKLFNEFHSGNLTLHSLNFGVIMLFPKFEVATKIQQYRAIVLLNVSF